MIRLIFFLFILVPSSSLFAYLDPGSFSYFLQIIVMVFVGGIVAVKNFWHNITSFFKSIFKKK
tara:strand:- start:176 stop:364 length:189 start_codon:yes stop_codon:yes gene_type:complete